MIQRRRGSPYATKRNAFRASVTLHARVAFHACVALLFLLAGVATSPARAAFEFRMSPADQAHAGAGWTHTGAGGSPRIVTRHLRPFQIPRLRFDGLEVRIGSWFFDASQLSADGYRERAAGLRWGGESAPVWLHTGLFQRGPTGADPLAGGATEHRGGALSIGGTTGTEHMRLSLASLDLVQLGDAGLPPRTFRAGLHLSASDQLELHAVREWNAREEPWDRLWMLWSPAPEVALRFGLDDHAPLSGVEVGGTDLRARVWVRLHEELAPTTGLELEFTFPNDYGTKGQGAASPSPTAPAPPATLTSMHRPGALPTESLPEASTPDSLRGVSQHPDSTTTIPASAPASGAAPEFAETLDNAEWRPDDRFFDSDPTEDWEDDPEQVDLAERPWLVPDSLSVWEMQGDDGWSRVSRDVSFRDERDLERELREKEVRETDVRERAVREERAPVERARFVLIDTEEPRGVPLPLPLSLLPTLPSWPGLADSVWQRRVSVLAELVRAGQATSLAALDRLPDDDVTFWKEWVPYLEPVRSTGSDARGLRRGGEPGVRSERGAGSRRASRGSAPSHRSVDHERFAPTVRVESRVRSAEGVSTKRTVWSVESSRRGLWSVTGSRLERSALPSRLSVHVGGSRWAAKMDWGRVRPRPGLGVDLGRSRAASGRLVSVELGESRARVRTRVGDDGVDLEATLGGWRIASSTGGQWEAEVRSGSDRLAVVRTSGDVWFLRSAHTLPLAEGRIVALTTERIAGRAAMSRTEARSLRFDRTLSWSTGPRLRLSARWKKNAADGGPRFVEGLPTVTAASESREFSSVLRRNEGPLEASLDLRVRKTATRSQAGVVTETSSFALRHAGSYVTSRSEPDPLFAWEAGVSGTQRTGPPRSHAWLGLHREVAWGLFVLDSGVCELRGAAGRMATFGVSWSAAAPRSVPTNTRWWVGTLRTRGTSFEFLLTGYVPLGVPGTPGWGELRVRTELPIPLSRTEDPG
ncbi:MAG: hypothetical protein R3E97_23840 [Candidatus Eisenbacteria bacterium]